MDTRFDQLSKVLAEATTRREALRRVGSLVALSALGMLGFDQAAWSSGECGE